MKCPKCGNKVDDWENECPYCKTNFEKYDRGETSKRNHSFWLNVLAIINIILCIMASIVIFINYSTTSNYDYITGTSTEIEINWVGIIGGIAVLITGLTVYFTLETIIDIHDMTEKIKNTKTK